MSKVKTGLPGPWKPVVLWGHWSIGFAVHVTPALDKSGFFGMRRELCIFLGPLIWSVAVGFAKGRRN